MCRASASGHIKDPLPLIAEEQGLRILVAGFLLTEIDLWGPRIE